YVAERLQQRIGDGAWRIPHRSDHDRELYVLLMLEHQSRADNYMALRMATYAGLLYQSLLRQKLITGLLPPILPVVLYSGRRPWRAHRNLAALLFRLEHSTAIEEIPELLHTL